MCVSFSLTCSIFSDKGIAVASYTVHFFLILLKRAYVCVYRYSAHGRRKRQAGTREYREGERVAEYTDARLRNIHGYFKPRHPFWMLLSQVLGPWAKFIGGIVEPRQGARHSLLPCSSSVV